jgi:hypothetical protein
MRISFIAVVLALTGCANRVDTTGAREGPLATAFHEASIESGVPKEVLLAVGYLESRWQMHDTPADGEHRGAVGLMGIDPALVDRAARNLAIDPSDARVVPEANVRVAAEALRELGHGAKSIYEWKSALAHYGAGDDEAGSLYAEDVFHLLDIGADGIASTGERLTLVGRGKGSGAREKQQALSTDSPLAVQFVPARAGFFNHGRWGSQIDRVVIHTTEGSYAGTIGWFQSPANTFMTSAHYVVRSSDGEITQMVKETDAAYHVLNWNPRAIGVEHEAISSQPEWFTDAMYQASANLVRDICARWGIPMDRTHIVGHVEVPGNDHTDPGHYWDWNKYMALLNDGSSSSPPADPCNGLDYAGQCDGTVLTWCENNSVHSVDCATTAQPACGFESDAVGNNCIASPSPDSTQPSSSSPDSTPPSSSADPSSSPPSSTPPASPPSSDPSPPASSDTPPSSPPPTSDPCGGLDYAGQCDGTVLSWCENNAVQTFDCATTNQVCGFQDDATGDNCIDAPAPDPCNGLDYAGQCDGATLEWCENGTLKTFDCSSTNQSCGWQDDQTGNNCL